MSDDPTLKSIDVKLDMFMASQKEVNNTMSKAMEQMASTSAKSDAMQVEINILTKVFSELSNEVKINTNDISNVKTKVAVNETLVKQTQDIKRMFAASVISLFLAYGWSVYDKKPATPQLSQEAITALSELIVKSNKG